MMLEGKKLRWYFNVGRDTAQVLMDNDVSSDYFNKLVLERWETCTSSLPTHICLALLYTSTVFVYCVCAGLYSMVRWQCPQIQRAQKQLNTTWWQEEKMACSTCQLRRLCFMSEVIPALSL